VIKHMLNGIAF